MNNISTTAPAARPAGLAVRIAAMIYEAALLFGVVFIVSYALLALLQWKHPLSMPQRWTLQAVLFAAVGAYFVSCWSRSGQTLAMKTWDLRLLDRNGAPPARPRALLRYLLAWQLFMPGLLLVAATRSHGWIDALVLLASFIVMLLAARFDREGRLLHDRWLGMRVVQQRRGGAGQSETS
jgi:uncharacterized RDD family membrane protein YckC